MYNNIMPLLSISAAAPGVHNTIKLI